MVVTTVYLSRHGVRSPAPHSSPRLAVRYSDLPIVSRDLFPQRSYGHLHLQHHLANRYPSRSSPRRLWRATITPARRGFRCDIPAKSTHLQ